MKKFISLSRSLALFCSLCFLITGCSTTGARWDSVYANYRGANAEATAEPDYVKD